MPLGYDIHKTAKWSGFSLPFMGVLCPDRLSVLPEI